MGELEYACRRNESGVIGIKRLSDGRHLSIAETRNLLNSLSSEIAELRKLVCDMAEYAGKSDLQEIIQEAESKISELDADELKGLQLMRRVQAVISNPSEIQNSSFDPMDEHTLSQADADALKKMLEDGTAKARFPLTGHGITEVPDAAEGG